MTTSPKGLTDMASRDSSRRDDMGRDLAGQLREAIRLASLHGKVQAGRHGCACGDPKCPHA